MKKLILIGVLAALLGGCTNFKQDVQTTNNNFRQSAARLNKGIREYFNPPPPQPVVKKEMPPSYCYKTLADIVCYDTAQTDKGKLVGKQVPSTINDQAITGGDPNVTVMEVTTTTVQSTPLPAPMPVQSGPLSTGPYPSAPAGGSTGMAPQELMPQ